MSKIIVSKSITLQIVSDEKEEVYFIAASEYKLFRKLINVIASERIPEDDHLSIIAIQELSEVFQVYADKNNKTLSHTVTYWAADQLATNGLK
jgi:hypothetical protein